MFSKTFFAIASVALAAQTVLAAPAQVWISGVDLFPKNPVINTSAP